MTESTTEPEMAEHLAALHAQAERLTATIGDVRLTARGRRPCPLEKELLAP